MIDQPLIVSYSNDFDLDKMYSPADLAQHNKVSNKSISLPQERDTNFKLRHSDVFKSLVYSLGVNKKGQK